MNAETIFEEWQCAEEDLRKIGRVVTQWEDGMITAECMVELIRRIVPATEE